MNKRALTTDCPVIACDIEGVEGLADAGAGLFEKDALVIGTTYVHPRDDWTLPVTSEWAGDFVRTVGTMVANGVDMPILKGHNFDEKPDPDDVLGYVKGANVSNGRVRLMAQFKGEDAENTARGVDRVSVGLLKTLTDGQGRTYTNALHHLAITPFPVVDGQTDFVPVAASRGQATQAPILTAAVETQPMLDVKELCGLLGDDVTEDSVLEHVRKLKEAAGTSTELTEQLAASKASAGELQKQLDKAGTDKPPTLDEDVEAQLVEGADQAFDNLMAMGRITKAVCEKLKATVVRKPGGQDGNAFALSRAISGESRPLVFRIADILKENDPVELRELTKRQSVAASRTVPGDDGEKHASAEDIKSRVEALGVTAS